MQEQLRKANRAFKTLSECNQVLVSTTDEPDLLYNICRIIVKFGGYRLAWVGFAQNNKDKTVTPVAQAGYEKGYLDSVKITWDDTEWGRGPTGMAIRTGKPSIQKNIEKDPNFIPWDKEAIKRGYASSIALPLNNHGQTFGALNIYAEEPDAFDDEEVELLKELAEDLAYGITAIRTRVKHLRAEEKLKQSGEKFIKAMEETIHAMALTVETRDPLTAGHQQRVTKLACAIAEDMKLSKEKSDGIYMASIIHDIGKIYVPAEILTKPGQLSENEFNLIKAHPQIGYDILKRIEFPWKVAPIVLQHHERMNGSGYPQGLAGKKILLEARIIGVADVVEAMALHRPYRQAIGISEALIEISQNKNILYDPRVVDSCLNLFYKKAFKLELD